MLRLLLATAVANAKADPAWRQCIRLIAGLVVLRVNSAIFIAAVVLQAIGAPALWPHDAPLMWAAVWAPAYVALSFLADAFGVDGMGDPDLDPR
ncbi:hypothetical protein [Methylorubrum sp. SL192]|uniref:hypothetical protein n=1 Tax=Methylorubrum sp. SL192 TaxID=2995167 RepID=UPI001477D582|nr:hypothetical protein [Methylorubrum sp. SL192]MCY1645001.1 hypothetical protein [Methylorubrum sp. SL192]